MQCAKIQQKSKDAQARLQRKADLECARTLLDDIRSDYGKVHHIAHFPCNNALTG